MSIRKITTSAGEVKWEVRVHENGRGSPRTRRRFDRKSDAENFVHDIKAQAEKEASGFGASAKLNERTFAEEAEYWLNSAALKFSPSHMKRMKGALKEVLDKFGHLTIDKINPDFLIKFQHEQKAKNLENSTVNRKIQAFTTVLNHSTKHRRIPYNPCQWHAKLNESGAEMLFWDKSEAQSFLKFTSEKYPPGSKLRWIYVSYLTALNTAMRAGEIWGIKPIDLAEDGYKITVKRQFNRVTRDFAITKGKKPRVVPCNAELSSELKGLILNRKISKDETIFMNENRKAINHDNFIKREFAEDIAEWSKESGGKVIRFHDMRHTATTLMIAAGIDIKTVKEICGHADISTTMNYVHMVAGSVERVAQNFSITAVNDFSKKEVVA